MTISISPDAAPSLAALRSAAADHPRHLRDFDRQMREARREILMMLAGEKRRRHDHRHLLAFDRSGEGRAQRNLGLAKADIAADKPVHRPAGRHIFQHRVDRSLLVIGLVIRKARAEFGIKTFRRHQFRRGFGLPCGGDFDEPRRHFENALAHFRLALLPGDAAEFVEFDGGIFRAIARQKLEIFDRQKQFVAIGIMQLQAIMRGAICLDRLQSGETANSVIDMDDDIARRERADFAQEILGAARRLAASAEQPVAQNILLGDDREILRLKPLLDADDRQSEGALRKRQCLRERRDGCRARKSVVGEHMPKPLARAIRPGGEDHPLAVGLQSPDMVDGRRKHIGGGIGALSGKATAGL